MPTIRTFIAIELPAAALAALADTQALLKKKVPAGSVRWTSPDSIHLTLHFLGDIEVSQVDEVARLLAESAAARSPFALTLGSLGCFPNLRRPRIVWVGVAGDLPPLQAIQRQLGEKLQAAIGFKPEDRPYSPHLTIGRVKDGLPSHKLAELGEALAQVEVGQLATLAVTEISLMRSDLKPAGAVYTQLASALLKS